MFAYLLSVASLLPWLQVVHNGRASLARIPRMADLPVDAVPESGEGAELARLSVVIAARNEAGHVEAALRSLVQQSHPDYEIIIVNDRSDDGTGEVIDRVAAEFPDRIKPVHVTELPEGWLGKCNALHTGGESAEGEFILFADADVEFESTVLERAHRYALAEAADQLAVIPETIADTFWEMSMLNAFGICFMMWFEPHRVMVRNSGRYVGIGAFNMVRTEMYRKFQGHRFLRMQVLDDVGLGKLVKFSGGTVRMAWGQDVVRLRWYAGIGATIRGFEKNFFAWTNYNVLFAIVAVLGVWVMFLWPWVGLFVGSLSARLLALAVLLVQIFVAAASARRAGYSAVHGLTAAVGGFFLSLAIIRSTWVTLRNGGVRWRDSFYPLKELRKFKL